MPSAFTETFASFRHRNYRLFFLGQTISLIGSWMQVVAQGWLVLTLTNSAFLLGLAGALHTLPMLLFSFWGGVIADHADKRRMVMLTNAAGLLLALILGLLVAFDLVAIWQIMILVFGVGTAMAFDIPGRQAFIIDLVGKSDLPNAIALNSSLFNGTRALGPAFAGLLIASVGIANCFFLNALSFLAPLICLSLLRLHYQSTLRARPRTLAGLQELLTFIRHQRPELGWMMTIMACNSIFAFSFTVLLPMIARDVLGTGPEGYGFLMAASGLGAFFGALTLATFIRRHSPVYFFWGGAFLMFLALLFFSCTENYKLALVCLFIAGFGLTVNISTSNSLFQLNVPDELRGRIMSLFSFTFIGFTPIGNFFYGTLGQYFGPCFTVRLGASLAIILSLSFLLAHPKLRRLHFNTEMDTIRVFGERK